MLQFAGLIDALMAFDYGMAVVDNEIAQMLKRVARGMEFSEDNLALGEIGEEGPGGMFVATDPTLELMTSTALMPDVADRDTRQIWTENGALDASSRALQKAREILAEDRKTLFSPEVEGANSGEIRGHGCRRFHHARWVVIFCTMPDIDSNMPDYASMNQLLFEGKAPEVRAVDGGGHRQRARRARGA
ncbi:MAG: hypothetical protein Ct9H300mP32_4940 [Verrucomicrobiota bacterium]|nr:MAG: hypothetical protein Ct9H300mP32_4940 [Verrucomicrobiota bacterium]